MMSLLVTIHSHTQKSGFGYLPIPKNVCIEYWIWVSKQIPMFNTQYTIFLGTIPIHILIHKTNNQIFLCNGYGYHTNTHAQYTNFLDIISIPNT